MAQQCKLPTLIPEGLKTATKCVAATAVPQQSTKCVLSAAPEQTSACSTSPLCVVCGSAAAAAPQATCTLVPVQSTCGCAAPAQATCICAAPAAAAAPAQLTLSIPTCGGGCTAVPVTLKLLQPATTCVSAAPAVTYVTAAPATAQAAAPVAAPSCCLCG